jgi:hypothetical protein
MPFFSGEHACSFDERKLTPREVLNNRIAQMKFACKNRYWLCLAYVGLSLACATSAFSQQSQGKLTPSLSATVASGKRTRVIIVMAAPEQGGQADVFRSPATYLRSVLKGSSATEIRAVAGTAYVTAEVDRKGLSRLERDRNVARLYRDLQVDPLPFPKRPHGMQSANPSEVKSGSAVVAVLDSGVVRTLPALQGRIVAEACFSSTSASEHTRSLCRDGKPEQTEAAAGTRCTADRCSHGTHVAEIVADTAGSIASDLPAAGIVSVQILSALSGPRKSNGDHSCRLNAQRCLSAWASDILRALLYVEGLSRTVMIAAVNLSVGSGRYKGRCDVESPLNDVMGRLKAKGIAVVAAAGDDHFGDAVSFPACNSNAIAVGATRNDGQIEVRYSNTTKQLAFVASGTETGTSRQAAKAQPASTSAAAAHIAGAIAVLRARYPVASLDKLQDIMKSTGTKITDPRNHLEFIQPNAQAALAALGGDMRPAATVPATACETICVEIGPTTKRVILALAKDRQPIGSDVLAALQQVFGQTARIANIGDGKILVLLPEGLSQEHVDKTLKLFPSDLRILPDQRVQPLQPSGLRDP